MDIRMNNMNWFSGYSLMNRLFSQKNGNQRSEERRVGKECRL